MPEIDAHSIRKHLRAARLYGILDLGYVAEDALESVAEKMCRGGVDILQLRAKGFDEHAIEGMAARVQPIAAAAEVPFLLNDYPHLVPSVGADGAHVGQ